MSLLSRIPDHLVHNILTPYLDAVSLIRLSSTNHAARELYRDDVDAIRTFFLTTPCANVRAARVMGFPCWRTFVKGITALCPHRMVVIEGWYPFDDFVFLDNGAGTFPFPPCASQGGGMGSKFIHPFHPFQTTTYRDQIGLHILRTMFPHLPQRTGLCESDIASFLKVHVSLSMAGGDGNAVAAMTVVRTDGTIMSFGSSVCEYPDSYQLCYTNKLSVDEFQRVHPKWTQWLRQGPVGPYPYTLVKSFPKVKWSGHTGTRPDIDGFAGASVSESIRELHLDNMPFTASTAKGLSKGFDLPIFASKDLNALSEGLTSFHSTSSDYFGISDEIYRVIRSMMGTDGPTW